MEKCSIAVVAAAAVAIAVRQSFGMTSAAMDR
jgi:hypothetical protein